MTKTHQSASPWRLLTKAAAAIKPGAFEDYFRLKDWLANPDPKDRVEFQKTFIGYYRLGGAGLTDRFKRRYFELLFACNPVGQEDPYTPLLLELYGFKTRRGHRALQASFVSKLVSMHDESRPIYDRHVSDFFGLRVPSVAHPRKVRTAGFVAILQRIQEYYEAWAADRRFRDLETVLFRKQPKLKGCHPSRLCDFLVWTIGDKQLS
jgi:hypothetical protein